LDREHSARFWYYLLLPVFSSRRSVPKEGGTNNRRPQRRNFEAITARPLIFWKALAPILGHPELAEDPNFKELPNRLRIGTAGADFAYFERFAPSLRHEDFVGFGMSWLTMFHGWVL
jgi:hypothetical protein